MTDSSRSIKTIDDSVLEEVGAALLREFRAAVNVNKEYYSTDTVIQNRQVIGGLGQALVNVAAELRIRAEAQKAQKAQEGALLPKPAIGVKR